MHDDQIRRLFRTLEDEREPAPAFADALYARLNLVVGSERRSRTPMILLAAALLGLLAAGAVVGSGLVRLPFVLEPIPSSSASASGVAQASASPDSSVDPSSAPSQVPSARPTLAPNPGVVGRVLFVSADGLRLRAEPSEAAAVVATLRAGQLMGATGTQESVDGVDWFEVRIGPGTMAGWVSAGPDAAWLRLVNDGAITFRCDGCAETASVVSVTPFGDASISTLASADELPEWRWSPDGTRLVASRGGTTLPYHIVLLEPDGTESADLGIGVAPAWSPDGTRLAWLGDSGLLVTDETLEATVVDLGGMQNGASFWSPDGTRFAIVGVEDPGIIDAPVSLYVVPVDGGEAARLTEPGYLNGVTWAPDASRLGFSTVDLSGEEPSRAFIIPVEGGEPQPLLDGAAVLLPPVWSPGGAFLAAVTPDGLLLAEGDGSPLDTLVPTEEGQTIGELRWSPSGRWLLYSTSTGREPTLWIVPVDGSAEPAAISPAGTGGQQADWQPVLVPMP